MVVAAKVMPARASEREAMQDAVEMAVLSSVQHPNIVSVYSCLTDMVETPGARALRGGRRPQTPALQEVHTLSAALSLRVRAGGVSRPHLPTL